MNELILFECPNYPGGLMITENSCAESWRMAKKNNERMQICKGCLIGAKNAGEDASSSRKRSTIDCICGRCNRPATRFVYNRICISCANRGYEFIKNKNAKGKPPTRIPKLFQVVVLFLNQDGIHYQLFDYVASLEEAEIGVIKKSEGNVMFGRSPPPLPGTKRFRDMGL